MSKTEKRVALVANAYLLERDALRVELDAMRQRAEAAEAANARCREANILLANSRNAAAEEWRQRAEAAEAALVAVPVDALRRFVQMGAIVRVPRSDEQELEFERLAEICEAWADSADELAVGTRFPMPVRELTELMDAIANCRGFPFGFERERETILRWLQQESEVQS